eukprot:3084295-Rhodomonas_salina.2
MSCIAYSISGTAVLPTRCPRALLLSHTAYATPSTELWVYYCQAKGLCCPFKSKRRLKCHERGQSARFALRNYA